MRYPTLWQVDMGDGTWAVCCLACRLPLYRGAKPEADRVFDTHVCEPVGPSRPIATTRGASHEP
jgi:hypothetical protein